jgi:hypothetical protein
VQIAGELVRKHCFEPARFVLIVQHYYRYDSQGLSARPAVGHFALQILQKSVRKMILRPLAPGIFLAPCAAVGTDILDPILLRIAVQSRPTGAAHTDYLRVLPFHGFLLQIHVHKTWDALREVFDTIP